MLKKFRVSLYPLKRSNIYNSLSKTNHIAIVLDGDCQYIGDFLEEVSTNVGILK